MRISTPYCSLLILLCGLSLSAKNNPLATPDARAQNRWVEAQYTAMSLQQRIGQLFMMGLASSADKATTDKVARLIEEHHIGGLIFFKGGPARQAQLTNAYQARSKTPLLIGMDAEWGLAMRLDSTYAFPWNTTLGALADEGLVERIGFQIGKHAQRLGVHLNFAPDVDVNNNPNNPIIGNRSFGEDPQNVAQKGLAFMQGMQRAGVLACGKHFPGHGNTATDSHKALPGISSSKAQMEAVELYPFRQLIAKGLSSVMVGHLAVPALESRKGRPATLSYPIVSGVLQKQLEFNGLIITDALNMQGVSRFGDAGTVALQAFLAGNDMLLMPQNVAKAKAHLIAAYRQGLITPARLEASVKKILQAKYKAGLHQYSPVPLAHIHEDLNSIENDVLYEEALEAAITVVKNKAALLPLKQLQHQKIAYVAFGEASGEAFLHTLQQYARVTPIQAKNAFAYRQTLADYNLVIIGFHASDESPWKPYKFSENERFWLQEIARLPGSNTLLTVFAKPYALQAIPHFNTVDAVVVAYQNSPIAQQTAAELIFGAIGTKGRLPVSAHAQFPLHTGIALNPLQRLGYTLPERVGLSSRKLAQVDRLVQQGLDSLMFPGAQVLVARRGKVVYHKHFGKPTYTANTAVTTDQLYDLASLTKILTTLPLVMKMEEEGELSLNDRFKDLMPAYAQSELAEVTILEALSHYGGLPASIAFYKPTLTENGRPNPALYRHKPTPGFSHKVAKDLYLADAYQDSIYATLGRQALQSKEYRYSDVAYYVLKQYIEATYRTSLDVLAEQFLYRPMGLCHTTFNPLDRFAPSAIVPTEVDSYYRQQTLQGYVHDAGAAMQGGVGGHAGLFSNANDVAKLMQMYLQGGTYGGQRFLQKRTVKKFNTCYFCPKAVRRGVGFDKPQLKGEGPTCGCVSRNSFGHSGFTGTYAWADPEEEIVYVFLSNRIYPKANNTLLLTSNLRTRIQQTIYESLL